MSAVFKVAVFDLNLQTHRGVGIFFLTKVTSAATGADEDRTRQDCQRPPDSVATINREHVVNSDTIKSPGFRLCIRSGIDEMN